MRPVHNIRAIILAAGASERMGGPKANLRHKDGTTLLARHVKTLSIAGIKEVYVVTGAHSSEIRKINDGLKVGWIENHNWREGQFSSIQAGLRAALQGAAQDALILPVDTANVSPSTIQAIISTALANPHLEAIIPEHNGRCGHPVYLSQGLMQRLLSEPASRLDVQLEKETQKILLPVSDPNITNNINTRDDWERACP